MAKISLTKTIDAVKLNKRTGFPESGPEVNIPFGALVEQLGVDRDTVKFSYLGEPYRCSEDLWDSATRGSAPAAASPVAAPAPAAIEQPAGPTLQWRAMASNRFAPLRAKVPGGWLVTLDGSAVTFVPDAAHEWDGGSPA
ncbi:MAG: hypothetical protein JSU00_20125 [Acidobacteria bacterium]|nr:hypothetical protein [Acidobacteriota bacterium]